MMGILMRLGPMIGGLMLVLMAAGGALLRGESSTAYWILGVINQENDQSIYLSSPDGDVQRRVVAGKPDNNAQMLGWLPNGRAFLYTWSAGDGVQELRRFSLGTGETLTLNQQVGVFQRFENQMGAIPNRSELTITLQLSGEAIFVVYENGDRIRQLTPRQDVISSSVVWSADGEWLYYVAVDHGEQAYVLYRQHFDGSQQTELLRVPSNLYILEGSSNGFFVISSSRDRTGYQGSRLYHVSMLAGTLTPLSPEGGRYSMKYFDTGRWFFVFQLNEDSKITDVYRLSSDGTDLTPLIEHIPPNETVRLLRLISADSVLVSIEHGENIGLYRLNVETGQRSTIISEGQFASIRDIRVINDGTTLIFSGYTGNRMGHYLVDLKTGGLRALMEDQLASRSNYEVFGSQIFTVYQSYALIMQSGQLGSDWVTSLYRLNIETDQYNLLYSETNFGVGGVDSYPPTNGREVLLYPFRDDGTSPGHLRIDLQTGDTTLISAGNPIMFSPLVDMAWDWTKMLLGGLAMIGVSIGWTVVRVWA